MSEPRITYTPCGPDATTESELSVLATVYKFVLFDSQARRGDPRDLTNDSTKKRTTSQAKEGKESADVYRNRL